MSGPAGLGAARERRAVGRAPLPSTFYGRAARGRRTAGRAPLPSTLYPPPSPLTPAAAYVDAFERFADLDGRTSRAACVGFWAVHVAVTVVLVGASVAAGLLAGLPWVVGSAVGAFYLVLAFFPSLALTARRLHDTGRTSWLCALIGLPPLTLLVVWWCLQPGEPGPNAWGQPPR